MTDHSPRFIGKRIRRIEDPALLRGKASYVDDVDIPGVLHAAFARSPHAHAAIAKIDVQAALRTDGVVAVFTADQLRPVLSEPVLPLAFPPGAIDREAMPPILAGGEVRYAGEPVAVVIAGSRYAAEDGVQNLEIDYDPLPAVVDPRDGLSAGSPPARLDLSSNLFTRLEVGFGDCDAAFRTAKHVFSEKLFQHRGLAHSIEGRGILVSIGPGDDSLTVWSSTQVAHELRDNLAHLLSREPDTIRVIACSVGGGFGAKFMVYPEEIAVAAAAVKLNRAVKWIEDRQEHFLAAIQERDQFWELEVAVDGDGRLRGVRGQVFHDQGAYAPHNVTVPYNGASALPNAYLLPAYRLDVHVVATNKPPVIPVRGAGYPQGVFAMERLLDRAADELGLDRADIRRRNLIPPDRMPYESGLKNRAGKNVVYDSGDYVATHDRAVEIADLPGFRDRQAAARKNGRFIGIGLAHGVKCTGRGPFESATVRVSPTGQVLIFTGAHAIGQGIETALAQICADTLGVRLDDVRVTCGDTRYSAYGIGAFGSRQTMIAGTSVQIAARAVRDKAIEAASQILSREQSIELSNARKELYIENGSVRVTGRPDLSVSLGELATVLKGSAGYAYPDGITVGLEATEHFRVDLMAYANAAHVCEVDVDIETGDVTVLRYAAVHDSGKIVNPLVAEGQICGGVVHGLGNALFERMGYDAQGQPITTTFADYLLPTATEVVDVETHFLETPSPLNPLGMKGVGEVSVVPVTSAVASAIDDALTPFGVRVQQSPVSPIDVLGLIAQGQAAPGASDESGIRDSKGP